MIQKIRRRFIRIALAVLACAMIMVTLIINAANLINVSAELRETLDFISKSDSGSSYGMNMRGGRMRRMRNNLSESRYFTAVVSPSGKVTLSDTAHDADSSSQDLTEIAKRALAGSSESGLSESYMYVVSERNNGSRTAVFLNVETKLAAVKMLAFISAAACLGGIALAWLLVSLFSLKAIRPLIQSAVQQKQFITDAGHELKTPLTVIGANMDVLNLDLGENEWVRSTQNQVARMRDLVNQLVYLSRMDEEDAKLTKITFDVSSAVRETAQPFIAMCEFSGKDFKIEAPEKLNVSGDEAAIRRMITILCDNAAKYAPKGDTIVLRCRTEGKKLLLETENSTGEKLSEENLKHLFDRFYRADSSRSKESGGAGLGLAIVRAIAQKHAGDVSASETREGRLRISCLIAVQ